MKQLLKIINIFKNVSFIFLFLYTFLLPSLKSQETATIYPANMEGRTGYVTKHLLGYNSTDDVIKIGQKNLEGKHRGWIVFDIYDVGIPADAIITEITLHTYTYDASGNLDNHLLSVRSIPDVINSMPLEDLWNNIGSGDIYGIDWDAMCSLNWHSLELNETANSNLMTCLSTSSFWWSLGIHEQDDNDKPGIFYGYGNPFLKPYCVVTYTLTPEANLSWSPDQHDFGEMTVNNCTDNEEFVLTNSGNATATGSTYLYGGDSNQFEIISGGGDFSLESNETQVVEVRFCPTETGEKNVELVADCNDCDDVVSDLTGEGVEENTLIANFEGNPTYVQTGGTVYFEDLTTGGEPNSWLWTFEEGDPATSNEENPQITYDTVGVWDVTLEVSNDESSDTEYKEEYIHVTDDPPPPTANFYANQTEIVQGEYVQFTNQSTNADSFSWEFEGGNPDTSTLENLNVQYNDTGTFNVTLTVSNDYGSDSKLEYDYITVNEPEPPFILIGELKIYYEEIYEGPDNYYVVSGNVSIDHILIIDGEISVDTEENTINGMGSNCLMYLDNSTQFNPDLPLVAGEFYFEVEDKTLINQGEGVDRFQMTMLDVPIDDIEVIDSGIKINGEIILPEIIDNLKVKIDEVVLQEGNMFFDGILEFQDVKVAKVFTLNDFELEFDTYNDYFKGTADMEFYKGKGLKAGIIVQNGKLDSVGVRIDGIPITIPSTGFQFENYGGSVFGLAEPPLELYLITDIKPVGSYDFVSMDDVYLWYTWKQSLKGGGILVLFNSDVATLEMTLSSKLIYYKGSVTIVPDYEFLNGEIEARLTENNSQIDMAGRLSASLQIPDEDGFPYWLISIVVEGLPYTVAETDNYLNNNEFYGNFSTILFQADYSLEYTNPELDFDLSLGWIDLDKKLFNPDELVVNPLRDVNVLEQVSLEISRNHHNRDLKIAENELRQNFLLESPTETLVIRLHNENGVIPFTILAPDSTFITPENFEQIANAIYLVNDEVNRSYYVINNPMPGNWTINIDDNLDSYLIDIFSKQVQSSIILNETKKINGSIEISWVDSDINGDAQLSLYYDNDNHGWDGIKIADGISENDIVDNYFWKPDDSLSTGEYYIYGIIADDSTDIPSISYSPNPVLLIKNNAPEKPVNLYGTVSDSSIFMNWEYPVEDSTIRFNVYYTTDSLVPDFNSSSYNIGTRTYFEFKNFNPGLNYHFMVTAMDTNYVESDKSNIIDIVFHSNNLNNSPDIVWQSIPDFVFADSLYSYQLICNDQDVGDVLNYELLCLNGSDTVSGSNVINISPDGLITWNPELSDIGYYLIVIKVTDNEGLSDSVSYQLIVLDSRIKNIYVEVNNPIYSCFGGNCIVSVKDNMLINENGGKGEVQCRVFSKAEPDGIMLTATETEPGSDYYRTLLEFSGIESGDSKLKVDTVDVITVEYINSQTNDTAFDISYFKYKPLEVNINIIGDTLFCANEAINVQLKVEPSAVAYLWSDGIAKTQIIDVNEPGYYSVKVSDKFGCVVKSDTIKILPLPTPNVNLSPSDTINICEGFELDPGECDGDYCLYSWNTGDTTRTINVEESGNYNVVVINEYQCTGFDNVFVNEVYKSPEPYFEFVFETPFIVDFNNQSEYGIIYHWDFGDGYSSNIESPSHLYDTIDEYEVILTVTNNCGSNEFSKFINVTSVSEDTKKAKVSVYPNPTKSVLFVKFRDVPSNEQVSLIITDLSGRIIKEKLVKNNSGNTEIIIETYDLKSGIYLLNIKYGNVLLTEKIIKL